MSKALYLVIGTVDRSLRCVEFFPTYEEAADFINRMMLIGRDEYDNAVAEMQHLRIMKGEPQDDDESVHLIDVKAGDMEAWDNNYDLDFYIEEVSTKLNQHETEMHKS